MTNFLYGQTATNNLIQFKDLNEIHPNLKFTYKTSQNSADFLDVNVSLQGGAVFTDLHI